MILSKYEGIGVKSLAVSVPNNWYSLAEQVKSEQSQDFDLKKFEKMTGVKGRYIASPRQTTADFCFTASKAVLQKNNINIGDVGAVVFVSQCTDYTTPATACVLQHRLWKSAGRELKNFSCLAFDVNLGCSGFVYGLNIVAGLMSSSDIQYALMLCGDTYARQYSLADNDKTDHGAQYLFGDAGAAVLMEKNDKYGALQIASCTDGSGFAALIEPYNHWRHPDADRKRVMDDITVFNFSTSEAPVMLKGYMEQHGSVPNDYDMLLLHQANLFIMKQIAKRAGFPFEKLGISIDTFGNTSSASIPATLVRLYGEDDSTEKKRFLACGYGVGLSWAACELQLSPEQVLPLIQTDEYFDDGFDD